MGEIIMTQFGINEKVLWQRSEKNIEKKSVHTIREIKTSTRYIYRQRPLNAFFTKLKIYYYSTLAMFTPQSKILERPYGKKALQLSKDLEVGKTLQKHRIVTETYYYMMDVSTPIIEHEIYPISIHEETENKLITNK